VQTVLVDNPVHKMTIFTNFSLFQGGSLYLNMSELVFLNQACKFIWESLMLYKVAT